MVVFLAGDKRQHTKKRSRTALGLLFTVRRSEVLQSDPRPEKRAKDSKQKFFLCLEH